MRHGGARSRKTTADVSHGLDLHVHARIDERGDLDQGRCRLVFSEVALADRVDVHPFGDVRHEDEHLDHLVGPAAGVAQAGVDRLQRDLELPDGVGRDGAIRLHPDHAREVDEVARLDDVAIVADRLQLARNHEALEGHDVLSPILTGGA